MKVSQMTQGSKGGSKFSRHKLLVSFAKVRSMGVLIVWPKPSNQLLPASLKSAV
jgi:hypothetical protein